MIETESRFFFSFFFYIVTRFRFNGELTDTFLRLERSNNGIEIHSMQFHFENLSIQLILNFVISIRMKLRTRVII